MQGTFYISKLAENSQPLQTPANMSSSKPSIGTPELRQQTEAAFEAGDLKRAQDLAAKLSARTYLGPWEQFTLGRIALATRDAKQAVTRLEAARDEMPNEGVILAELAAAYAARKRWSLAAETLGQAIAQRDDVAALQERYAVYLRNAGQTQAAEAALSRAFELNPKSPSVVTLQGEWRLETGDEGMARDLFERAIDLQPGHPPSLTNLALLEEKTGRLDTALRLLAQVKGTRQDEARAQHRSGVLLLTQSMFAQGWPAYAARLRTWAYASWQHLVQAPYWSGEDLSDKHLLVWIDQGLGEQVLTAGFFPELVARAGQVTIACDPRLVPLFQRSFAGMAVMSLNDLKDDEEARAAIDVQATISELGMQLRAAPGQFPAAVPYLVPDPVRAEALRSRLKDAADGLPLVGISWRSANPLAGDAKSTSLSEHWVEILKRDDVRFVSLQYGDTAEELTAAEQAAGVSILRVEELDITTDVDGFAALTAAMDAVLSTSNTTVHVAGALGKPTAAILPSAYGRPWYWFEHGDTSPWYPAVKLVRSEGDWRAAVQAAVEALKIGR